MGADLQPVITFLEGVHPYDTLTQDELARVASSFSRREVPAGTDIYRKDDNLEGLYLIKSGGVEINEEKISPREMHW